MQNVKNTMIEKLLAVVAPHPCLGCGELGTPLCQRCKRNIVDTHETRCLLCGKTNPNGVCRAHGTALEKAWFMGNRNGVLQMLIGFYKFQRARSFADVLSDLVGDVLPLLPAKCVLVPIPTARSRIRERGYDHTLILARYLGVKRLLPVEQLFERLDNSMQHTATRDERIEQIKGAFTLKKTVDPKAIYIVIDDVVTTGSTIVHAATLLKQSGARHVWGVVLARQPLD